MLCKQATEIDKYPKCTFKLGKHIVGNNRRCKNSENKMSVSWYSAKKRCVTIHIAYGASYFDNSTTLITLSA